MEVFKEKLVYLLDRAKYYNEVLDRESYISLLEETIKELDEQATYEEGKNREEVLQADLDAAQEKISDLEMLLLDARKQARVLLNEFKYFCDELDRQ